MQPLHFVANCISSTTVHQYFIFLIIVIFALIHHYNNEIIMKTELSTQLPSIMAMWEFFNENLHFKLSKYEFTQDGIKVIYIVMGADQSVESQPKRLS